MLASLTLFLTLCSSQASPPGNDTTAASQAVHDTKPVPDPALPAAPRPMPPAEPVVSPGDVSAGPPPSMPPPTSIPQASGESAAEPKASPSLQAFGVDLLNQEPLDSDAPVNTQGRPLAVGGSVNFNALPGFGIEGHLAYRLADSGRFATDFGLDAGIYPFFGYGLAVSGRAGLALSVFTASGYFANPFVEFGAYVRVTQTTEYDEAITYTYLEPTIGLGAEILAHGIEPRVLLTWPVSVEGLAPQGPSLSFHFRYRF